MIGIKTVNASSPVWTCFDGRGSELVARPPRQYRGIFSLSRVSTTYDFPILGRLTSPFKGLFYIDMSGLKGD